MRKKAVRKGSKWIHSKEALASKLLTYELNRLGLKTQGVKSQEAAELIAKLRNLPGPVDRIAVAEAIYPRFKYCNAPSKQQAAAKNYGEPPRPPRTVMPDPVETEIREFYDSWAWKTLRYDFIKDKRRRCQCCGATPEDGVTIVVDHIKPIRKYWHLRLDFNNLQLLCGPCNQGKGSHDQTDWREPNIIKFPGP